MTQHIMGNSPIIFSFQHSGTVSANELGFSPLNPEAQKYAQDIAEPHLFELCKPLIDKYECGYVNNTAHRSVIDLNRDPTDRAIDLVVNYDESYEPKDSNEKFEWNMIRCMKNGVSFYGSPLSSEEVQARVDTVHKPFHASLETVISTTVEQHGYAIVLDIHSCLVEKKFLDGSVTPRPHVCLGTRDGNACNNRLTEFSVDLFKQSEYDAVINAPFKGVYTLRRHGLESGKPVHMMQVELRRDLFNDPETQVIKPDGFKRLQAALDKVVMQLIQYNPEKGALL